MIVALHEAKSPEEFTKILRDYAKIIECRINEDELQAVLQMKDKFGAFYCPCRPIGMWNEKQREPFKCPCIMHLKDIKTKKACYCKLLVSTFL